MLDNKHKVHPLKSVYLKKKINGIQYDQKNIPSIFYSSLFVVMNLSKNKNKKFY